VCEAFYVRDYLDKKEAYVRAMMKEIQWDKVEDRIKDAESSSKRKVIKR
jgi:superoxide dismutase